jgi:hypothetical protein
MYQITTNILLCVLYLLVLSIWPLNIYVHQNWDFWNAKIYHLDEQCFPPAPTPSCRPIKAKMYGWVQLTGQKQFRVAFGKIVRFNRQSRWSTYWLPQPWLPDFSMYKLPNMGKYTKYGKIYQMTKNYQMAIKYVGISTLSIPRPSKIYPNWYFWHENIPSGNPGCNSGCSKKSGDCPLRPLSCPVCAKRNHCSGRPGRRRTDGARSEKSVVLRSFSPLSW